MEDTKFDLLLRRAALQTTRRESLAALVGGALLIGTAEESEANAKARRRKKKARRGPYRGFNITINNPNPGVPAVIMFGDSGDFNCCRQNGEFTIAPGGSRYFQTHRTAAWLWIDTGQKYWFQFHNYLGNPPFYRISVFGQTNEDDRFCCLYPQGDIVERQWSIDENSGRYYNINGHLFLLRRHLDSRKYKNYMLLLPPTL